VDDYEFAFQNIFNSSFVTTVQSMPVLSSLV